MSASAPNATPTANHKSHDGSNHAEKKNTRPHAGFKPVVTPNGSALAYKIRKGVKVFHLVAEPVEREFSPGMTVKCWGYNGQTPGPTIEAVEGDRVRIMVTNKLPEHTTIHWHGIFLPQRYGWGRRIEPAPYQAG